MGWTVHVCVKQQPLGWAWAAWGSRCAAAAGGREGEPREPRAPATPVRGCHPAAANHAPHLAASQGALYASRSSADAASTLVYRPYEPWAPNSDWSLALPSERPALPAAGCLPALLAGSLLPNP